MTYKIGTRVKKVRGVEGIGTTGVVVGIVSSEDMHVRCDAAWVGCSGNVYSPDVIPITRIVLWERIIPEGQAPGIKDTCEPLDKLLSEVSREAV